MHFVIIVISLLIASGLRWIFPKGKGRNLEERWQNTLFCFLFPPLLIIMTAFAVYWMGHHGQMLGMSSSRWECHLAIAFLGWSGLLLIYQGYRAWKLNKKLQQYPKIELENLAFRLIPISLPYSAQMGFWQSQLTLSEGLLNLLKDEQLEAVLAHEKGHEMYKDTFNFFWLGYLKSLTFWLPYSQFLWQELLLLREIRADQAALATTDALTLAEALLTVAQFQPQSYHTLMAAFNDNSDRLEQRIEAILNPSEPWHSFSWQNSLWLLLIFLPLLTIPFHH